MSFAIRSAFEWLAMFRWAERICSTIFFFGADEHKRLRYPEICVMDRTVASSFPARESGLGSIFSRILTDQGRKAAR